MARIRVSITVVLKRNHISSGDIGESNSGDHASKDHPMEPADSKQLSSAVAGCSLVLDDDHKSDGSSELTVNYMSPDLEGPAQ